MEKRSTCWSNLSSFAWQKIPWVWLFFLSFLSGGVLFAQTPAGIGKQPLFWVKADAGVTLSGSSVSAWADQSTSGNDFSQPTSANQPGFSASQANFNPALTFNYSQWVRDANGIYGNAKLVGTEIYTVYRSDTSPNGDGLYGSYVKTNTQEERLMAHGIFPDGYMYFGIPQVSWVRIPYVPSDFGAFNVNTYRLSNSTQELWFNGGGYVTATGVDTFYKSSVRDSAYAIGAAPSPGGTNVYEYKHHGFIAEMIQFDTALTADQRFRIESYLGIKYGLTLKHNYVSSNYNGSNAASTTVFDITTYGNNVAGIGRDDAANLLQKQSRSQNSLTNAGMITMGVGSIETTNALNTSTSLADGAYIVWGDDNGAVSETTTDVPGGAATARIRLTREWKVQVTGTVPNTITVQVDLTGVTISGAALEDFRLLIDRDGDGDFTTGTVDTVMADPSSTVGGVLTFNNVTWDADSNGEDVFTIQTGFESPIPPCIISSVAKNVNVTLNDSTGTFQLLPEMVGACPGVIIRVVDNNPLNGDIIDCPGTYTYGVFVNLDGVGPDSLLA